MPETMFGYPTMVVVMIMVGIVHGMGAIIFLRAYAREKSELMSAFLSFLISMAGTSFFFGLGMYTNSSISWFLGLFFLFTGSIFMLKFPLSALSEPLRKPLFYLAMLASWVVIIWLMVSQFGRANMMPFSLWYMIIVNGFITSFYMIWIGIQAKENWLKLKAIGGGAGVASCCMVSHSLMMTGIPTAMMMGVFFQMIAPAILLFSVFRGHRLQSISTESRPV